MENVKRYVQKHHTQKNGFDDFNEKLIKQRLAIREVYSHPTERDIPCDDDRQ
jgi:hypothetical protein